MTETNQHAMAEELASYLNDNPLEGHDLLTVSDLLEALASCHFRLAEDTHGDAAVGYLTTLPRPW